MAFALTAFTTLLTAAACGGGGGSSLTGPSSASISVTDPSTATSLTYTTNIAPILQSDCTMCHNSSSRSAGYDFTSYAGVMRAVVPGSAQSRLVAATQPGGLMYGMFGATANAKSATIRRWVVDFNAAQ
jgi:hypothetical protein